MLLFEIDKHDIGLIVSLAIMLAIVSFGFGVDHQLTANETASEADRKRIYCETPGRIETYCHDKITAR